MSNGYILAAGSDLSAAQIIAAGFGLDVLDASSADARTALAQVENIGALISANAAQDASFVALMRELAAAGRSVHLIEVDETARALFADLPAAWPSMPLDEARRRAGAAALARGEGANAEETPAPEPEAPEPQTLELPETEPEPSAAEAAEEEANVDDTRGHEETFAAEAPGASADDSEAGSETAQDEAPPAPPASETRSEDDTLVGDTPDENEHTITQDQAPSSSPTIEEAPAPEDVVPAPAPAPQAPAPMQTQSAAPPDADQAKPSPPLRRLPGAPAAAAPRASAPADATAFAPKKLRRGTPELVRIVIHQPKDIADVIKAARKIDPRTEPAPSAMSIGEVALGASVGVSLEVRGAACEGVLQRRTWAGAPIDFSFSVEPDAEVKQAVILARVFVDDAQIGVIAFTRSVTGAAKAQPMGDKARMKRHKRVFLSYSSKDRETVSAIATAYQMAGVEHFWDRASLKSGEEWHPRLRREIDRADLFHLCWSKAAAGSEWVEKEAGYALTRRRRSNGKRPDITVQMLDGPPWAKHPDSLDTINFDDFVRAAIVGYARGDGGETSGS
jgi:hypothetical protein